MSAKLSRAVIKSIVKECLVEILEEGLSSSAGTLSESRRATSSSRRGLHQKAQAQRQNKGQKRSVLDSVSWADEPKKKKNTEFNSNIKRVTENMTSDPVLSDILADTARTTLQEQAAGGRTGPGGVSLPTAATAGDQYARAVATSDPADLFSDSAGKWADLAFAAPINRS